MVNRRASTDLEYCEIGNLPAEPDMLYAYAMQLQALLTHWITRCQELEEKLGVTADIFLEDKAMCDCEQCRYYRELKEKFAQTTGDEPV